MKKTGVKQAGGNLLVFRGSSFQRGYGLGSFFKSLARSAIPFIQQGAKTTGRAILHTAAGANIANDVASGKNVRDSLNNQLNQTVSNMVKGRNQSGSGNRQPIKRKAPRQKIIKRQTKKARGSKVEQDIIG